MKVKAPMPATHTEDLHVEPGPHLGIWISFVI